MLFRNIVLVNSCDAELDKWS